jgi:nicotinate-nucleotide pyrophosphorylase (carboxylating)
LEESFFDMAHFLRFCKPRHKIFLANFLLFLRPFWPIFSGVDQLRLEEFQDIVKLALTEDVGSGDVTTLATVPAESRSRAVMNARNSLIVAGLAVSEAAFTSISQQVVCERKVADGQAVKPGTALMVVTGPTQAILTAERVALNFIQRLSGVATLTGRYVEVVKGTGAKILDTRKTTPGLRHLEKYAVTCGGGTNHRIGLYDMVLIKDNHLAALAGEKPNPIAAAVQRARAKYPALKVEVEADTLDQARQAAEAGADYVLLDNMQPEQLREAVRLIAGRSLTEASGGVNLSTLRAIVESGVDFISVGALTHSAPAVDIGLDFEP